jgi:cytidine deaminase
MNPTPRVSTELRELVRVARAAARHAYAPYSRFRVGAAVRTARGGTFSGGNVENASYGLTLCAERAAVAAAVAAEGPKMRLTALACVVAGGASFPPCGACRQVIAEFSGADTPVVYLDARGLPVVTTTGELLPQVFRLKKRA